jgi:hypothetical protein
MSFVKNFIEFINEGLNKEQWFNYKDDTYLKVDNPGEDEIKVANKVMELLQTNDPAKITFTSDNDSFNYDYRFFKETILPTATKKLASGIKFTDYVVFYELYDYKEKPIVAIYIKDNNDVSYMFIKQDDFEFFSTLMGGDDSQEEQPAEEENTEEENPEDAIPKV